LTRDQRAEEFELLSRLANHVQCKRLVPHRDASRIAALCEIIENAATLRAEERQSPIAARRG